MVRHLALADTYCLAAAYTHLLEDILDLTVDNLDLVADRRVAENSLRAVAESHLPMDSLLKDSLLKDSLLKDSLHHDLVADNLDSVADSLDWVVDS